MELILKGKFLRIEIAVLFFASTASKLYQKYCLRVTQQKRQRYLIANPKKITCSFSALEVSWI